MKNDRQMVDLLTVAVWWLLTLSAVLSCCLVRLWKQRADAADEQTRLLAQRVSRTEEAVADVFELTQSAAERN